MGGFCKKNTVKLRKIERKKQEIDGNREKTKRTERGDFSRSNEYLCKINMRCLYMPMMYIHAQVCERFFTVK